MDLAVIKEMITMFGQAGESAKELCIWWILSRYLPTIIFGACWSGIAIWTLKAGINLIRNNIASEKLSRVIGVYPWNDRQLKNAIACLEKHKDEI